MPNHCFNRITISAGNTDSQNLAVLVDSLKNEEEETCFDLNAIVPIPPELENIGWGEAEELNEIVSAKYKRDYGANNWYDWCVLHWGTKWNTWDCTIEEKHDDYVVFAFVTAWSPPTGAIEVLREQCPDFHVRAFFDEPGMEVGGYY